MGDFTAALCPGNEPAVHVSLAVDRAPNMAAVQHLPTGKVIYTAVARHGGIILKIFEQ